MTDVTSRHPDLESLFARAAARVSECAADWIVADSQIVDTLRRSVASWGGIDRGESPAAYLGTLRLDDLALAIACRAGVAAAWDRIIGEYRPILYAAARAMTREEPAARELADSLWAELYGIEIRDGQRRSLLDYFHGRSSLATWLRTIIAQRHIDQVRENARFDSIERAAEPQIATDCEDPQHPTLLRVLESVLNDALRALMLRDQARLRYYYCDLLTVRQIGRILGEHASTVSRKLERTRSELRDGVEMALRSGHRLSDEQIQLCYDRAGEKLVFNLAATLAGASQGVK
jgi:RNA polymerase sigma-70 factor (ECF subfamily)